MMDRSKLRRSLFVSALLIHVLLLIAGIDVKSGDQLPYHQNEQGTPTPTPELDRLLEPTLSAQPNQADIGSQDYWLNCLVCHGDLGQGLTEEFRQLYPPEETNCWQSGCHGARPSVFAFTLPDSIPPIIGAGYI